MHELGIAKDLWAVVEEQARVNNLRAISKITIVLGEASGVEADFLNHSLKDHTLPGTAAAGAEIEFIAVKLAARCRDCGEEITAENIAALACPACRGRSIEIIAGKEIYVQSIEGE